VADITQAETILKMKRGLTIGMVFATPFIDNGPQFSSVQVNGIFKQSITLRTGTCQLSTSLYTQSSGKISRARLFKTAIKLIAD